MIHERLQCPAACLWWSRAFASPLGVGRLVVAPSSNSNLPASVEPPITE